MLNFMTNEGVDSISLKKKKPFDAYKHNGLHTRALLKHVGLWIHSFQK